MSSRMEKYEMDDNTTFSRSEKNKDLYQSISRGEMSRFNSYNNVKVIDSEAKEIDLNKIRNYVDAINHNENTRPRRSLVEDKGLYRKKEKPELEETKDYDINSVLEKAREQREKNYEEDKYKKLRDTQFDILSKLKVLDEQKEQDLMDEDLNTEERTLINLINTVADNKLKNDLLAELEEENEALEEANERLQEENSDLEEELLKTKDQNHVTTTLNDLLKEEIEKTNEEARLREETKEVINNNNINNYEQKQVDDTFFTDSLTFKKEDFSDEEYEDEGSSFGAKLGIFFIIILIIAIIVAVLYFVFDINSIEIVKNYAIKIINKIKA